MSGFRRTYLSVRRWTDGELIKAPLAGLALAPVAGIGLLALVTRNAVPFGVMAGLMIGWGAFLAWRGYRLARAGNLLSARHFDRRGKYDLPPEYAASESVTNARTRRRRMSRKT